MAQRGPFAPFKQAPQRIPVAALDRLGKFIEPGHVVMFHNELDLMFEVVSVHPVMNPNVPNGQAMQVMLKAEFPVQFMPNMPNQGMVIVETTQARKDAEAKAAANGSDPHAEPVALSGTGVCKACEAKGPLGEVCQLCGDAKYEPPSLVAE